LHDVEKAIKLSGQGEHIKALAFLEHAVHDSPDYFTAHNWLAVEYSALHRFPDAVTEFQRLVASDPESPIGYANLAVVSYNAGRYDESEEIARRALQVRGDYNLAQFVLAMSLLRQNRETEQARHLLISASRTIPAAISALQIMDGNR
jgi:tetratricopeptide (TPR) repeat protein